MNAAKGESEQAAKRAARCVAVPMSDTEILDWMNEHDPLISREKQLWRCVMNANWWGRGRSLREAVYLCAEKGASQGDGGDGAEGKGSNQAGARGRITPYQG